MYTAEKAVSTLRRLLSLEKYFAYAQNSFEKYIENIKNSLEKVSGLVYNMIGKHINK